MIEGQENVSWGDWVALAEACEEHGLVGLFRSDHYASVMGVYTRGALDAWATITALAGCTERIRLGSLVSPATFRHPSGGDVAHDLFDLVFRQRGRAQQRQQRDPVGSRNTLGVSGP